MSYILVVLATQLYRFNLDKRSKYMLTTKKLTMLSPPEQSNILYPTCIEFTTMNKRRNAIFTEQFRKDLSYWIKTDRKVASKIRRMVEEIQTNPCEGTGNPKPLRRNLSGCWSRRINEEHRIVYQICDDDIVFLQCRYHYYD